MDLAAIIIGLAGVMATAAPVIFATVGETLSERSGVINLSVNGTIILSAMTSFAVAVSTDSLFLGFVVPLTTASLAYFLGTPIMGLSGPRVRSLPLPLLSEIPILGPLFFQHTPLVYLSYLLIAGAWFWIFKTRPGLMLQGV